MQKSTIIVYFFSFDMDPPVIGGGSGKPLLDGQKSSHHFMSKMTRYWMDCVELVCVQVD